MTGNSGKQSVAVIGLGYVGTVTAGCLSDDGHTVIGVDVGRYKVDCLNEGKAPLAEPGLDELIRRNHLENRLSATCDIEEAVAKTRLALVCVGTPSDGRGSIDLTFVRRVCKQLGMAIAKRSVGADYIVVIRSTILPNTMVQVVHPILEESSGRKLNKGVHTVFNPEFLREGTAIKDYRKPPKIVVGTGSDHADQAMRLLYATVNATYIRTSVSVAEMVKYTDNAWHAAKITFGNEIGEVCRNLKIDSHQVMDIFLQDEQLNISKVYLKPGFAFGGSCLPKDLRAILHFARHSDIDLPMLSSILVSNNQQIERIASRVLFTKAKKIGIWGLSFKPNTDDLRESPAVILAEKLIGKGCELTIYDPLVRRSFIFGSNRKYIEENIPHFESLLVDDLGKLEECELVILTHATPDAQAWLKSRKRTIAVLDLTRVEEKVSEDNYQGISW